MGSNKFSYINSRDFVLNCRLQYMQNILLRGGGGEVIWKFVKTVFDLNLFVCCNTLVASITKFEF